MKNYVTKWFLSLGCSIGSQFKRFCPGTSYTRNGLLFDTSLEVVHKKVIAMFEKAYPR